MVTLLTVQNTQGVRDVSMVAEDFVSAQLTAVLEDLDVKAAKTGALGNAAVIAAVARQAVDFAFPLVVDPVMISKHGGSLIDDTAVQAFQDLLLPQAFLVTPNRMEAERLTGVTVSDLSSMEQAALRIHDLGCRRVLVKGGGDKHEAIDLLSVDGTVQTFVEKRIPTKHTHGTGCVLSAAITANLAKGIALPEAIFQAKRFLTTALAKGMQVGKGIQPVNLL